jgi:hypothetical protein
VRQAKICLHVKHLKPDASSRLGGVNAAITDKRPHF